jgi:PAP2 superfamily
MYAIVLLTLQTAGPVPAQMSQTPAGANERGSFYLLPRVKERPEPPEAEPPADVVLRWNDAALEAVKTDRTPPPLAARNLAMVHVAVYDAVNGVRRTHTRFLVDAVAPPGTSEEAAAAAAAHRVLLRLYPKHGTTFDHLLEECLARVPDGAAKEQGVELGLFTAANTLQWRAEDGVGKTVKYTPKDGPGWWRPTPPDFQAALAPEWPKVACFAMRRPDQFRPGAPPDLTNKDYADALREVRKLGGAASRDRTADQTEIAKFWADGAGTVTPPGHWNRVAATVSRKRGLGTAENARLFALLNIALADAGIACWDSKYHYSFWRPVQAIREADTDADADWEPLLPTPPFPSYASGHSTFSGAAAAVLAEFFGTDAIAFTSTSDGLPGVERSYRGFREAADEAGRSRIYGGIHYEFDNAAGLSMGRDLGRYVARRFLVARRPASAP